MKKVISLFLLAGLIIIGNTGFAQLRKIPVEVTNSFSGKYPAATDVEWKDRLTGFTAGFTLDNTHYLAAFDNKGRWENTEHQIEAEDLPEAVKEGFDKSKYADWVIERADYIELPDDQVQYRVLVASGDIKKRNLHFNSKGRLVRDKLTL